MTRPRAAIAAGHRIDQERHVVVDDRDPHPPVADLAAGRGEVDRDVARLAAGDDPGDQRGRFAAVRSRQSLRARRAGRWSGALLASGRRTARSRPKWPSFHAPCRAGVIGGGPIDPPLGATTRRVSGQPAARRMARSTSAVVDQRRPARAAAAADRRGATGPARTRRRRAASPVPAQRGGEARPGPRRRGYRACGRAAGRALGRDQRLEAAAASVDERLEAAEIDAFALGWPERRRIRSAGPCRSRSPKTSLTIGGHRRARLGLEPGIVEHFGIVVRTRLAATAKS